MTVSSVATSNTFGRFFLPGPTEVRPEILAAQTLPMIGHRGKGMEELIAGMMPGLKQIFRTGRPVYLSASSATGLMEAAIRNCGGRKVLSLVNGAFSDRFYRIGLVNGLDADTIEVPLGEVHPPERLEAALRKNHYDAVTVVHSETSTGALNPIRELAEVTHRHTGTMLLVDSVSGVAGAQVESDGWELDFVLTGSQKAFALPPGLALGVAQPGALERARATANRGIYFDLVEFEDFILKNQTPNTPALSLLYALAAQVKQIVAEGIEARWARHLAMAERTWSWAAEMRSRGIGMRILAPEGFRSPTVSCLTLPEGKSGIAIDKEMKRRGFTISPGYGKLKDTTVRIGHMGDHTVEELNTLLQVLEDVLLAR